ncbi:Tat pathway signal protein [Streptomyces sp. NPDC045456]|uniref:Tat pathway signal protein n=1 Tax=Streptomyces sp. NPDC045456 TaxID=3155254 RepID=UPI0033DD2127
MAHTRNTRLAAVIRETGWSQEQVAAHFRRVAAENQASELLGTTRSHINQWVRGVQPSGRAPDTLCETLSRRLRRTVTRAEVGLRPVGPAVPTAAEWSVDTLTALVELGSSDLDMERRHVLGGSVYSVVGLSLPGQSWWDQAPERARSRPPASNNVIGSSEVEDVREMMDVFSRRDQRRGGRAGRTALAAYLWSDLAAYLNSRFPSEALRRELFSAAGELVYLCGWMNFDASRHGVAESYFKLALRVAAEADDAPLAGHILRAMAHQAVDLGHPKPALDLATASLERKRYSLAAPREKALLGVVHARSLAAAGQRQEALAALLRAEDDLASADGGEGPGRVFFFGEASLAHETACTLRDLGDLKAAQREFARSVRTRRAAPFARTHSVTLGYLGAVQAQQGELEAACHTWSSALDAMDGVQSGRAREAVVTMRRVLSPFRNRGIRAVTELDARAKAVLERVA